MKLTMFHNPKCSKSRETLKLLQENGVEPKVILYLETPPGESELKAILKKLGMAPKTLIRFKEKAASDLGLSFSDDRRDAEWIKLMCAHPILIERPVVWTANTAVIGRPPEQVLRLIEK